MTNPKIAETRAQLEAFREESRKILKDLGDIDKKLAAKLARLESEDGDQKVAKLVGKVFKKTATNPGRESTWTSYTYCKAARGRQYLSMITVTLHWSPGYFECKESRVTSQNHFSLNAEEEIPLEQFVAELREHLSDTHISLILDKH